MKEHLLDFFEQIPDTDEVLIKGYEEDVAREITCKEFRNKVFTIAHFIKSKGVSWGDRVAVISEKCPETIAVFFSIWLNGAVCVPVCETLQPRELSFILDNAGVKMILSSRTLREQIEESLAFPEAAIYDFSSWRKLNFSEIDVKRFIFQRDPEDIAFLIYTSGSTGNPKGVMLTHQNIAINAAMSADYVLMKSRDTMMSILPYWHSFAITAEIFAMLHVGGKICIPRNKSTLMKDFALFRPTIALSVPRLSEMIKKGIENSIKKKSSIQQKIFKFAQTVALNYHLRTPKRHSVLQTLMFFLIEKVVFKKVKENFGGRIRYFVGGGAPLTTSLQEFFLSIDIPIYQGYGLTEASPVISINSPYDFKVGTSGRIIPWMREEYGGDYTFEDENGNRGKELKGELLVKGKCVMKGYWKLEDKTRETLEDGWLRTGDMGYIDEDGFLVLFGRKKNLLCLKGGEKFYPEFIEERIKTSPYILHAMVVGEGYTRCSVLININTDLLEEHPPEKIELDITREIRELTEDFQVYQRPVRHLILPEFTVEEGLLTNTLKIKRHKILERYQKEIDDLLK